MRRGPSGALVHEAAEALSGEQFDRLQDELKRSFSGQDNAGRPMLLEGGLKWQTLSLTPADMDFAGLKAAAAREIALAFGVPPMLLGLPGDATYANYREANKALWRQTILPLAGKILDALSEGLRPWFAELKLAVDLDAVPALSEDRERLWAQVAGADFLTPEEKREAVGLPPAAQTVVQSPNDDENKTGILELKYNPWHDTQNGQFTHEGQGARYGAFVSGPMSSIGRGSNAPPAFSESRVDNGKAYGGGGVSGSWEYDKPKKTTPKIYKPKREVVKPSLPKSARTAPAAQSKPTTRKVQANGYQFELDAQRRTVRARGQLRLDSSQGRDPNAQRDEGRPDRQNSDHGGHFIGRQFGGPKEAINLFAQDANFNRSGYAKLENEWRRNLRAKRKVYVDIQAYYGGNSKRPDVIVVSYYVDGYRKRREFPNKSQRKSK